ncbi:uncharacterized protein JCM15063_005312 [Sporobolomyces koalae]|uniref:uncharacterized protein n=1 Tax=Sporobolomyces koalae TaxID=500713 RepID=UPI003177D1E0
MRFTLATVLAASALLFPASLAAPLPNPDGNLLGSSLNDAPSCAKDGSSVINVGVGVGIGNSIHQPKSKAAKVKQGDQGSCPPGWTRSLLEVDLCIEVGGSDHRNENNRPATTRAAHHGPSLHWGPPSSSTTKVNPHRATHTSAPQHWDQGDNNGHSSQGHSSRTRSATTTTTAGRGAVRTPTSSAPSSATSAAGSPDCPRGQTRGTGDLVDVCVDVDLGPVFVGGGIKIGGLVVGGGDSGSRGSPTTTAKNSPAASARASSSASDCSDGTSYDALLRACVAIDTDPLFVGGNIRIGGQPQTTASPSTSTSSRKTTVPTTRPSSNNQNDNGSTGGDVLPDCDGPNDPRAFLKLCVKAGNLLGVKAQLGGSDPNTPSSQNTTPANRTPTPEGNKKDKNGDKKGPVGSLPPCDGANDPDAILGLCVQVGDILGATVVVGGSNGASSTTSARSTTRTPLNAKASTDDDNSGNILDLNLGNLLNAKIGTGPGASDSSPTTDTQTRSYSPIPTPVRKIKQTAPVVTYPDVVYDEPERKSNKDDDAPLISASVSAQAQLGPSPTSQRAQKTSTKATQKACPVGQLLHLGICVDADVVIPGLVSATAAATVAV